MIFVTGDTHRIQDFTKLTAYARQYPDLSKGDYLIILGDFGVVWDGSNEDKQLLQIVDSFPWTTLVVDGNHDNIPLLNTYPKHPFYGGIAKRLSDSVFFFTTR